MADDTPVYIHTDEIAGGRLRVGQKVKFDTEVVEGQDGKLKGVKVSGPAVVEKGVKLTEEQMEEDKKKREEMKAKTEKEIEGVYKKVTAMNKANKVTLLKALLEELAVGELKRKEETRRDPTEGGKGRMYTKGEFIAFYGSAQGTRMWSMAGKGKGRKPKAN
eukprot:gene9675-15022_t